MAIPKVGANEVRVVANLDRDDCSVIGTHDGLLVAFFKLLILCLQPFGIRLQLDCGLKQPFHAFVDLLNLIQIRLQVFVFSVQLVNSLSNVASNLLHIRVLPGGSSEKMNEYRNLQAVKMTDAFTSSSPGQACSPRRWPLVHL